MMDFLLEIAFLSFLGILYYFYQKKKILQMDAQQEISNMSFILHSLLAQRGDTPDVEMDALIEAIDDFLSNKTTHPPTALLKKFSDSDRCSEELRMVIQGGL